MRLWLTVFANIWPSILQLSKKDQTIWEWLQAFRLMINSLVGAASMNPTFLYRWHHLRGNECFLMAIIPREFPGT